MNKEDAERAIVIVVARHSRSHPDMPKGTSSDCLIVDRASELVDALTILFASELDRLNGKILVAQDLLIQAQVREDRLDRAVARQRQQKEVIEQAWNEACEEIGRLRDTEGCICRGNWRLIIKECEGLIGKRFHDKDGQHWTLFGIVDGADDYYYGMSRAGKMRLLSCVGSIEGHGYLPD